MEAWLLSKEPPLCDVGELYREKRASGQRGAHTWLLGQFVDLARQLPAVWRARRREAALGRPGDGLGAGTQTGRGSVMDGWVRAVRFGLRGLVRNRVWALAALVTLALGTGAATSLFSVAYSVLFRPLPYPESDQLVRVYPENEREPGRPAAFSVPDWEDWRDATTTLQDIGLYTTLPSDLVLTGFGDATELETAYVTPGFFEALSVPAALGSVLRAEDEQGDRRAVVLSDGVWRRVFGADPAVVGTTVMLKAEPYRVVGVMPEGFGYPNSDIELYAFLSVIPATSTPFHLRVVRVLDAVARLAPGTTPNQARQELASIASQVARANPDSNEGLTGAGVMPLRESAVADVRPSLLTLMAGAGLFLVAALINLSGLVMVRQISRRSEYGIRRSLGAGRRDLVRQVLAESGVTGGSGNGAGGRTRASPYRSVGRLGGDGPSTRIGGHGGWGGHCVCASPGLALLRGRCPPSQPRSGRIGSGHAGVVPGIRSGRNPRPEGPGGWAGRRCYGDGGVGGLDGPESSGDG